MLKSVYAWMERKGEKLTKPMLLRMGWIGSAVGLALLVSLWREGSDDIIDWCGGLWALCMRPFAGWIVSRAEAAEQGPPE